MLKKVRNNTFETNSSSIHSLSIMKEDNPVDALSNLNYTISFGEYGQYRHEYTYPREIICYLWTMVHICEPKNKYIQLMREWLPNCNFPDEPEIHADQYEEWYDIDGYIDHGGDWFDYTYDDHFDKKLSDKTKIEEMFESKEMFANIVFNGRVFTTSDSCDVYEDDDNTQLVADIKPKDAIKTWIKWN